MDLSSPRPPQKKLGLSSIIENIRNPIRLQVVAHPPPLN